MLLSPVKGSASVNTNASSFLSSNIIAERSILVAFFVILDFSEMIFSFFEAV